MNNMPQIVLVVPCYNEAQRLDKAAFVAMVDKDPALSLLFVDDGSHDGTADLHACMVARRPGRIEALVMPQNRGKAEAVRQGMLRAMQGPSDVVGYVDADLATPSVEIQRLCTVFREREDCEVLLGSRVRLLGRSIDRDPLRHYLGRAFATAASLVLRLPVYDTQCGAKLFRRTATLMHALEQPFLSRWVFDVELLSRLLIGAPGVPGVPVKRICEEPLQRWTDCKGSKLGVQQMLLSLLDLGRIEIELSKRRLGVG
jgi:dolichyl-phosphate beta-glucosyltransferase